VEFPLYLRIPAWSDATRIRLNGTTLAVRPPPGTFVVLHRTWHPEDEVELRFPMETRLRTWTANHDTVSVDRGPLTYSLLIAERPVRHGGTDAWPAWNLYPDSPWNYGLVLPERDPANAFGVVERPWPANDQPFDALHTPIQLKAQGRIIPEWTLDDRGLVREVQPSPVRTDSPTEPITLIPMGAARLRISAFPVAGDGSEAHTWTAPAPSPIRASHCYEGDTADAVIDQILPRSSSDHDLPRFTWWPHRGTREWIEWHWPGPQTVNSSQVYWFDDTGIGYCRLPASWQLYYRQDGQWLPVPNPSPFEVAADRFNTVRFDAVSTDALRLEVRLQEGFSGGILEWQSVP